MSKEKTSIVFTGDIGFDRYMDRRWEDDQLLSQPILDFFHSADHVAANVEGTLIDAVDDGSRGELIQEISWKDGRCDAVWRTVHPIPEDDDFFENVWRTYRENQNVY